MPAIKFILSKRGEKREGEAGCDSSCCANGSPTKQLSGMPGCVATVGNYLRVSVRVGQMCSRALSPRKPRGECMSCWSLFVVPTMFCVQVPIRGRFF